MTAVPVCEFVLLSIMTQFGKGPISIPRSAIAQKRNTRRHETDYQAFTSLHLSQDRCSAFLPSSITRFNLLSFNTLINPLTPNDPYSSRTAPLTSKRCILYIYSTNIGSEYFKRDIYSPFFPLQNAVCFIILTYLVPVLFTF